MNKTDRMLAIILEMQRKGVLRAEDLACTFETSVRTIYRDVQALSEAGVPIIGAPGTGYSLMEGYFLPPISFTVEEAVTLLIGTDFIEQRFDRDYGAKAQASRKKIEGILPTSIQREADRVRRTVKLVKGYETVATSREKSAIETIRHAILGERKVSFGYAKPKAGIGGSRHSYRLVAPYGLVLVRGSWILIAYCDLRQDIRHFRLSRMEELAMSEEKYKLPADFQLKAYIPKDNRSIEVRLQASPVISDRVKESEYYFIDQMQEVHEGLLVTMRVRAIDDVLQWVLGWGAEIEVLEPEALRERVYEEALRLLRCYGDGKKPGG